MPPLIVDFTKAKTFEVLPNDNYPAQFINHEVKAAADTNYPNLIATFTIKEGAPAGAGREFKKYFTSNPDGLDFFRRAMVAMGTDPDEFRGEKAATMDMDKIAHDRWGDDVILKLTTKEYEGEQRNEIQKFIPVRGS